MDGLDLQRTVGAPRRAAHETGRRVGPWRSYQGEDGSHQLVSQFVYFFQGDELGTLRNGKELDPVAVRSFATFIFVSNPVTTVQDHRDTSCELSPPNRGFPGGLRRLLRLWARWCGARLA